MLTFHVRRSDVDAFAKGKLSLDEFRAKASLAVYQDEGAGRSGGGGFGE